MKEFIKTRDDLKNWLKADFESYDFRHPILGKFTYGENSAMFGYMKILRHLEYYTNKQKRPWDIFLKGYYLLKLRRKNLKMQLYIAPNTVGPGFNMVHHGYRRVDSVASVGKNCTILPMVLIGKKIL